ncbi:uncharacterized protein N7443_001208 [Penicillium atrosanguineum]|uniref:uncharacterized protein n=1 Tax=Penicillium atrosanguineum TaxID=1132637 RepID=UPI00238E5CC4|nr:uncharacterized protein N7443_001208 [Penicillium atrosanguineum]KAJ5147197.1 hypothetical protein N7526_000549 [Penicillium atrosanguineum]KAJ5314324.1 hypothetical protein N7443_001208 [Penicillium atrosanguineum]
MPLDEEGAKWSCEPCIRGHRSSKCQHFDRLMMKVPKAGRPLAKCPHPKGTCSCQKTFAFMVRIPKGSTCLCRPLYKVPASTDDSSQSTPAPVPSASSSASAKVQKSGRRQSHLQAAPGNLAKALESVPDNLKLEDGVANNAATAPHHSEQNGSLSGINSSNGFPPAPVSDGDTPNGSGCCSKKPQVPPVASNSGGSCCSGKSNAPSASNTLFTGNGYKTSPPPDWNDMSFMNFATPQIPAWQNPMPSTQTQFMQSLGMHSAQSQPLYMNGYAPHVTSAPSYSNTMSGLGTTQTAVAQFAANHPQKSAYTHSHTHHDAESCHDCKCGDDCQCLGCAAHPFNNTTRQHVQEMGVMMTFDGDEHTPETITNAYQPSPFHSTTPSTPMNFGFMQHNPPMENTGQQNNFDPYSDPNSTMSSGYSSPLRASHNLNQQLMHPSEYYTLEYPVGIPSACSDVTGSCQCGNDCSCVGCLTHSGHNGVPLDAPIPEPSIATTTEQHSSSHRHTPVTSVSHNSHITVLDNVSVPCLSPRTLETSMI